MTLSEFSYYVRKFGPIVLIGFILFLIFFALMRTLLGLSLSQRQDDQAVVYEPVFGTLDSIPFSHSVPYPDTFTISIDNIEGRPLTPASEANVYFMPSTRTRFGYQQTIGFMARAVGIDTEEQQYTVDGINASYEDALRKLDIDITNFNYAYELDYKRVPTIFGESIIPSDTTILEEAKSFLRQMNKLTPRLTKGIQNIIYLRYDTQADEFIVVDDPNEANVVEIDFYEPDIEEYPILPPTYFNSQNYVTIVFRSEGNVIIKSQVKTFDKDLESFGPYPLKTGNQAWQELEDGQGIIVSTAKGSAGSSTDIVVREMFLGYYDPEEYHPYLMPVYVFLGDNGFAAYVSAVSNQYVKTPGAESEDGS